MMSVHDMRNRRNLILGLPALAAGWAVPGALGSGLAQLAGGRSPLFSSAFPSFGAAVAQWSKVGGDLIVDRSHVERAPVTMYCVAGLDYRLLTDGAQTITYAGPQFHWFFCVHSEGPSAVTIGGALTVDGAERCSMPFFARFEAVEGAERRDFLVNGLIARNARMRRGRSPLDGSLTNAYGACGMFFYGGFDLLQLRGVKALGATREAGAGRSASQGCAGIGVVARLGTTSSARRIRIEDFEVVRVDSDDPPGSRARTDMDGVLVFQSAERGGAAPVIQRGTIREAAGRAVKMFAAGGGGVTRDITIHRSVPGSYPASNDVAHQHGDGTIENVTLYYSGRANSGQTVPISMSAGQPRPAGFPFGRGVIRNIRIQDTSGRAKKALVTLFYSSADPAPRSYLLADIRDSGTAEALVTPGGLGSAQDASIEIERVDANLTAGLVATEDYDRRLRVTARGLVNRNPRRVPSKVFYNGRAAPPGHGGTFRFDATVRGVAD